jgi:hypothetical protein
LNGEERSFLTKYAFTPALVVPIKSYPFSSASSQKAANDAPKYKSE